MPSAAAAFWAGLLLWQVRPAVFGPWAWAALGVGALAGSWLAAAPREETARPSTGHGSRPGSRPR